MIIIQITAGIFLGINYDPEFSLFLLNKNLYNDSTIIHEFIHCIQFNSDKLYAKTKLDETIDISLVEHLKLTEDELNYIYDEREFYPIIYDLCHRII